MFEGVHFCKEQPQGEFQPCITPAVHQFWLITKEFDPMLPILQHLYPNNGGAAPYLDLDGKACIKGIGGSRVYLQGRTL